jgi:hypothetical protein
MLIFQFFKQNILDFKIKMNTSVNFLGSKFSGGGVL